MLKLLILCEYPTLSGGERSMLATLDGVASAGFDVHIMAPGEGPLAEMCRLRGIPLVTLPFMGCHGHVARADGSTDSGNQSCCTGETPVAPMKPTLANRREQLASELTRLKPDLLHANSLAMGRLAGPVAAELGITSLAHLRDIIKLKRQAVADLNRNMRLLAVSRVVRDFHVAAGLDAERTFVLYNGVDLEWFYPRSPSGYLHRELGIPLDAPLIGTIGQICLRKAQDMFLEAANRVGQAPPDNLLPTACCQLPAPHWLLIGERWSDKQESQQFEQRLHTLAQPLAGRVHFLGARDDVPELLNELTLLVHTARQEPLGRVLLEAAASGTAVVATDVGGMREIFPSDSSAARLVPPDDPERLAQAVVELLSQPKLRLAMKTAARREAETRFDADVSTAGLVEHYRALIEGVS